MSFIGEIVPTLTGIVPRSSISQALAHKIRGLFEKYATGSKNAASVEAAFVVVSRRVDQCAMAGLPP
jgi:hypothetical protein